MTGFDVDLTHWTRTRDTRTIDANLQYDPATGYNKATGSNAVRPNPAYGPVYVFTSDGRRDQTAISSSVTRRLKHRVQTGAGGGRRKGGGGPGNLRGKGGGGHRGGGGGGGGGRRARGGQNRLNLSGSGGAQPSITIPAAATALFGTPSQNTGTAYVPREGQLAVRLSF